MNNKARTVLRNSALFLMFTKLGALMPAYADINVKNIVIGSGCSSICINGECESTCKLGDTKKNPKEELIQTLFEYSDFSEIAIKDLDATIQYSEKFSVVLTEAPSLIDKIRVSKNENKLSVFISEDYLSYQPGSLLITLPRIDSLQMAGSSDIDLIGFNQSTEFVLEGSGSSDIVGKNNSFEKVLLHLEKQSDMDFSSSNVTSVNAVLNGQSDAKLKFSASDNSQLIATLSGQSDIKYCGSPILTTSVKDSAGIKKNNC